MSGKATGWTFDHSPFDGATFIVHLAIADSVNDQNENEFWMRLPRLAEKARVCRAAASAAVNELVLAGLLEDLEPGRPPTSPRPRRFRFLMPSSPPVGELDDSALHHVESALHDVESSSPSRGEPYKHKAITQVERNHSASSLPLNLPVVDDSQRVLERFEKFWNAYPKRDGKRVGKKQALAQWLKMTPDEHVAAWRGVQHYAASGWRPRDAVRWLRDRLWEDWQEPADRDTSDSESGYMMRSNGWS